MKLENQIYLNLVVDGLDLPLDTIGLPYLQIDSSSEMGIPCAKMVLPDVLGAIRKAISFRDGTLIDILIGTTEENQTLYPLIVHNVTPRGTFLELDMCLRHPRWYAGRWDKPIRGTSSDVLTQLAAHCEFDAQIEATNDSGIWHPTETRCLNFARSVVAHSYKDAGFMMAAIGLNGSLRYRNVLAKREPLMTFGYSVNTIPIKDFRPYSSGIQNVLGGYKQSTVEQSVLGTYKEYVGLEFNAGAPLNRNDRVADYIKEGQRYYRPIVHPANSHPKYTEAFHRNSRFMSLMNTSIHVSTGFLTGLQPLDVCGYDPVDIAEQSEAIRELQQYKGAYTIISKGIIIKNNFYHERYRAVREGSFKESI